MDEFSISNIRHGHFYGCVAWWISWNTWCFFLFAQIAWCFFLFAKIVHFFYNLPSYLQNALGQSSMNHFNKRCMIHFEKTPHKVWMTFTLCKVKNHSVLSCMKGTFVSIIVDERSMNVAINRNQICTIK